MNYITPDKKFDQPKRGILNKIWDNQFFGKDQMVGFFYMLVLIGAAFVSKKLFIALFFLFFMVLFVWAIVDTIND